MSYEYVCNWCLNTTYESDDVLREYNLTIDDLLIDEVCLECYLENKGVDNK